MSSPSRPGMYRDRSTAAISLIMALALSIAVAVAAIYLFGLIGSRL